jgi:hypothetical protein
MLLWRSGSPAGADGARAAPALGAARTLTRLGRCVDAVKHKIPMRAAQQQGLKMERSDFWEARRDHCRETALALRRLARRAYFPSIRRELIDFANRYDQMAKRCEWHWHSETIEQQIERENAMMAGPIRADLFASSIRRSAKARSSDERPLAANGHRRADRDARRAPAARVAPPRRPSLGLLLISGLLALWLR